MQLTRGRTIGAILLAGALFSPAASAGLGPQNLLVVIDEAVPESVAIGEYYIQVREIPECCVYRVYDPPLSTYEQVLENLAYPIKQYLEDQGLTDQVDVIVLTRGIPYRVGVSSMACILHSERTDYWPGECYYGDDGMRNPYFEKAEHFDYNRQYQRPGVPLENRRIIMMLSGFTVEGAMMNIDSGVYGDETAPPGTVYMISSSRSSCPRLYPRHNQIPPVRAQLTSLGIASEHIVVTSEGDAQIFDKPDVMGYLTGRSTLTDLDSNTFLAGSWADHMTSFGGDLLNPGGQTSILELTDRGVAGSAGTVSEPCNYWQKFPHALLYSRYTMGFALGEVAWMSLEQPWQTIFVGDPLAAPYAVKPVVEINTPADGAYVKNTVHLDLHIYHPRGDAISRVELYVDGKFAEIIATYGPAVGNRATLTVDDYEATYTSFDGQETASEVLTVLEILVGDRPTRARAVRPTAYGKLAFVRIVSKQNGAAGNGVPYSISVEQGSGSYLGYTARADGPATVGGMDAVPEDNVYATPAVGHVYLSVGLPEVDLQHDFDVSDLDPGEHELMIVAYQGDEFYTQGHARVQIIRRVPDEAGSFEEVEPLSAGPIE